jgi:hypothetical protein
MGIAGVQLRLPCEPSKLENRKSETQERTASEGGPYKSENLPGDPGDYARADQYGGSQGYYDRPGV